MKKVVWAESDYYIICLSKNVEYCRWKVAENGDFTLTIFFYLWYDTNAIDILIIAKLFY